MSPEDRERADRLAGAVIRIDRGPKRHERLVTVLAGEFATVRQSGVDEGLQQGVVARLALFQSNTGLAAERDALRADVARAAEVQRVAVAEGERLRAALIAQETIGAWVVDFFGSVVASNRVERALRVLEEAIELAQAEGVDLAQVDRLSQRAYTRPAGAASLEGAQVGVTILAWAWAAGVDLNAAVTAEYARISTP